MCIRDRPWRAGVYQATVQGSQSLGPSVPILHRATSCTDWPSMLAAATPHKNYAYRPMQRYVSAAPKAVSPRRRMVHNADGDTVPARPHTASAARGDCGNFDKASHSHRHRRAKAPLELHPWSPRKVTLRERRTRGGAKKQHSKSCLLYTSPSPRD